MSAKEMFEELGYEFIEGDRYWLVYAKDKIDMIDLEFTYSKRVIGREYIRFGKPYKSIEIENKNILNLEELQAINQQVKELRWLDNDN